MRRLGKIAFTSLVAAGALGLSTTPAAADGTETLGPPSLTLSNGTGIAVGGIGLFTQPATFSLDIPSDATVKQVILYYEAGHHPGDTSGDRPDETVRVDGHVVTAQRIGGPTPFYGDVLTATHRADVTGLNLIAAGPNVVTMNGLDTDEVDDGAGLVVIYEQPGPAATIQLVDGNDVAFANFEAPRNATVPQTFRFAAAAKDRRAELAIVTASLHDPVPATLPNPSGDPKHRPNFLDVTIGSTTTRLADPLGDHAPEWDSGMVPVTIPAGATSLTVRYVSAYDDTGDLPASLVWLGAGLVLPNAIVEETTSTTTTTVPPTTAPPTTVSTTTTTTTPTSSSTTTTAPVGVSGAEIPRTGSPVGLAVGLAAAAALVGGLVLLLVRRRAPAA